MYCRSHSRQRVADYCAIRRLDDDMRGFGSLWQPLAASARSAGITSHDLRKMQDGASCSSLQGISGSTVS
jgi:hypothetical protein